MALNKIGLKQAIKTVLNANSKSDPNDTAQHQAIQDSIESLAEGLTNAIDAFVRSGTVNTNVTTTVTTSGPPTSHTGTGSGSGTGNIT